MPVIRYAYLQQLTTFLGSITSHCSGNEPTQAGPEGAAEIEPTTFYVQFLFIAFRDKFVKAFLVTNLSL